MADTKSLASLTPTLLARKGGAKPAMRPQLHPISEFHEAAAREMGEDLGWNDMGADFDSDENPGEPGAQIVSIGGEARSESRKPGVPNVVLQREALSGQLAEKTSKTHPVLSGRRRAAFTLRLDEHRHLRLRLASAVLKRSGQDIVSEALDEFLSTLADVEALAAKVGKSS